VTTRNAVRAGVIGAVLALSLVAASPAFAIYRDDGDEPGGTLSPLMMLLIFVGGPIVLFLGIALLVALPSIIGGPRYRPGMGWRATPEWYGGPEAERDTGPVGKPEPGHRPGHFDTVAETLHPDERAGARAVGVAGGGSDPAAGEVTEPPAGRPDEGDGGASARW
jgi:hypothetical protein